MRGVTRHILWVIATAAVMVASSGSPASADTADTALPAPAPSAVLAELAQDVGGRGAAGHPQRYAYLYRLDSHLQEIAASRLGTGSATSAQSAAGRQGVTTSAQGDVAADVYVDGDTGEAADALRALGMRVTGVSDRAPQRMVEGFIPPAALAQAAALPSTHAIVSPFSELSTGATLSQGDAAIHGPAARAFGPTGLGVSVGIISDSINQSHGGVAASQATGDLPASVVVLSDKPGGTDEGRAMAEIVYDEAPGISGIVFATANGGPAAKAAAIDALVSHGVRAIADDTSYVSEPFFQDDVIAQAVDRARAAGVAYFIAAGNDAQQSWEGSYSGGASEDFDPSPGAVDGVQAVGSLPSGQSATLVLQWAEPWGHATDDFALDLYRINGAGQTLLGTYDTNNITSGIPEEVATVNFTGNPRTYGIGIRRISGTGTPLLKYIDFTNGAGTVSIEHPTNSSAISPDAASATGALTVAASRYSTPTTPESYSARGPVTRYFDAAGTALPVPDVRAKPSLAAPDGVATSVFGFSSFSGTSAATPAAAGIAALILSAKPLMSMDVLSAIMTNPANALDCTLTAGAPDRDCGSGFVLADRALGMALDATPPVVTPAVSPAVPDGANQWYRGPVTVSWSIADAESPVSVASGCAATAPGDTVTTSVTCTATSAGGSTTSTVTLRRDSTPPTTPTIAGVAARTYAPDALPGAGALACRASDPTSGIDSCTVTGYGAGNGRHTLTAVALNDAGLTTTATVTYTVAKPAAISQLTLAKGLTLARLARSGASLKLRVASARTHLAVSLVARVGTRRIALGRLTRKAARGKVSLRAQITPKARRQLAGVSKAVVEVTVTGTAAGATRKTLRASRTSGR
jgi:subtilisin family serine protease